MSENLTISNAIDTNIEENIPKIADRFRKFLPVVVDVETAGFNAETDALLEIACIPILMNDDGKFYAGEALNAHIEPFDGANLEARALEFTGIDPNNPMRKAIAEDEKSAIRRIFKDLKQVRKDNDCRQCVLVGHNAHFDLAFLNAVIARTNSKIKALFMRFRYLIPFLFRRWRMDKRCLQKLVPSQALSFKAQKLILPFTTLKKQPNCFVPF